MITSYSSNIIFFDTEFSSLDFTRGEILSLGFVKSDGEELYLELEFDGVVDEWPRENILPNLSHCKVSRGRARELVEDFIGEDKPYVVAYVNQFDMIYFYKFFGLENFNEKFNWIPIDFASILFSLGVDSEILVKREESFFDKLQIDLSEYHQHNALDDARLLREVYIKLIGNP